MIVLTHNETHVKALFFAENKEQIEFDAKASIVSVLNQVSQKFQDQLIIWVNTNYKENINYNTLNEVFHHKRIIASFSVNDNYKISNRIGYVEQTPFTNVSREVNYPTWLMSTDVGGVYTKTLSAFFSKAETKKSFNYFLNSVAKLGIPNGLFCYSEPKLLKENIDVLKAGKSNATKTLFLFVKQHYKPIWAFNLLLCFLFFEKKLPLLSYLKTLFVKQLDSKINLNEIEVNSTKKVINKKEVDVIIPTIGRKDSLYDVLIDLSKQTILPKNVIIVEQNPDINSKTQLNYIEDSKWPFTIIHEFIHKTGACNARNLALSKVTSGWVLLGDDDNRFESDLLEKLFKNIKAFGATVATTMYIQPNEKPSYFNTSQTDIFGSGNSMLKTSLLKQVRFDTAFEFGYREDSDFGMQLRKTGNDVIYFSDVKITHLKLPFGGFRTKFKPQWIDDKIQPKPSPTVMLFVKKHYNQFQKLGYKYTLFLKFYKKQSVKNPFTYLKLINKQWKQSEYWSEQLLKKNNA